MRQDFKKFGVFDAQEELERKQRREEDELYGEMVAERRRQMQLLEQVLAAEREHTVSELIAWFESRGTARQERDDSLNKVASRTCIAYNSVATAHTLLVVSTNAKYHGLRGSASPVLTATGFVNGRWQFSTPHRINTP